MRGRVGTTVLLVKNNRVFNRPLGPSLRSFTRTAGAHSAYSLHSALLRYAHFALFLGSLTHFAHSLVGRLKFLKCVFAVSVNAYHSKTRFSSSHETLPEFVIHGLNQWSSNDDSVTETRRRRPKSVPGELSSVCATNLQMDGRTLVGQSKR